MSNVISEVESGYAKSELPEFKVGDHISVGVLIREAAPKGAKKQEARVRVQNFIGDVIAMGTDGVALDAFGATLLSLEPNQLDYLRLATDKGRGTSDWRSLEPREIEG